MSRKYRHRIIQRSYIHRPWHSWAILIAIFLVITSISSILLQVTTTTTTTTPPHQLSTESPTPHRNNDDIAFQAADIKSSNIILEKSITDPLYKVTKVVDGDTIWVDMDGVKTKIRFIGIDTPESTNKIECYGKEASAYLSKLIDNQYVSLEYDSSQGQLDKYNRTLAYVYYEGINLNFSLIQHGFAREYTYDAPYKYQSQFRTAEQSARENHLGLWSPNTCNGDR